MGKYAIEFNNVGKQYRLGMVGTGSLQHDINRWWQTTILRREDPYLRIGETNNRSTKGNSDYVWALKNISFNVEQGDVVGIIGKNGAGKSTLLKLLSHITAPSVGSIRYRGRIASLLEVGTGFVGELTARQNIYMNGSIMGMTKREITSKLDEIVDFAGIERYLDTPVKRFSSGMYVRLGFAVAAHLEPEILVVDEVLAVGDAEFQKKAIGKMQDVSKGQGRTVLFVSHNMAAVSNLCTRGIVLSNGLLSYDGDVNTAISHYIRGNNEALANRKIKDAIGYCKDYIHIDAIRLNGTEDNESTVKFGQKTLSLEIEGVIDMPMDCEVRLHIKNEAGVILAALVEGKYKGTLYKFEVGKFSIIKHILLPKYIAKGNYIIDIMLHRHRYGLYCEAMSCAKLSVEGFAENFCPEPQLQYDGLMGLESVETI